MSAKLPAFWGAVFVDAIEVFNGFNFRHSELTDFYRFTCHWMSDCDGHCTMAYFAKCDFMKISIGTKYVSVPLSDKCTSFSASHC